MTKDRGLFYEGRTAQQEEIIRRKKLLMVLMQTWPNLTKDQVGRLDMIIQQVCPATDQVEQIKWAIERAQQEIKGKFP